MRHGLSALLLVALAACAAAPDPEPEPTGWRDRSRPIASAALFDPARFEGRWVVVGSYPTALEQDCAAVTLDVRPGVAADWQFDWACLDGSGARALGLTGRGVVTGPGRYALEFAGVPFEAAAFWVLWVDESYRTAVIGTPPGTAGWILNRDAAIPADRMAAAREMLDFNGYDLGALVER